MNMSAVSAPREREPAAPGTKAPRREGSQLFDEEIAAQNQAAQPPTDAAAIAASGATATAEGTPDVDAPVVADAELDPDIVDATRAAQEMIAAAVKTFAIAAPVAGAPAVDAAVAEVAAAPAAAAPAATTIEQAVHQILDQLAVGTTDTDAGSFASDGEDDAEGPLPEALESALPETAISVEPQTKAEAAAPVPKGPVATTAVRDPAPLPENDNPSHVHLVLDDGPERVVVTVNVRGNEVNAFIRGGDEQTAAAIARNAASLDHALRAGGLDLSSFSSERDLEQHAPRERRQHQQPETEEEMA